MVPICTASASSHVAFDKKQIPELLGTCSCLSHNHNHKYVSTLLNHRCPAGTKKMISMKGDIFTDSLSILNYHCFLPLSSTVLKNSWASLAHRLQFTTWKKKQNLLFHRAEHKYLSIYKGIVTFSLKSQAALLACWSTKFELPLENGRKEKICIYWSFMIVEALVQGNLCDTTEKKEKLHNSWKDGSC